MPERGAPLVKGLGTLKNGVDHSQGTDYCGLLNESMRKTRG